MSADSTKPGHVFVLSAERSTAHARSLNLTGVNAFETNALIQRFKLNGQLWLIQGRVGGR